MADVRRAVPMRKSNGPSRGSFLNPRKIVTTPQRVPSLPSTNGTGAVRKIATKR